MDMTQFKVVNKNGKEISSKKKTTLEDVLKLELKARNIDYISFLKTNNALLNLIVLKNETDKEESFEYLENKLGIDKEFWDRIYTQSK